MQKEISVIIKKRGYDCKIGDTILVKIEDVNPNCKNEVNVKCTICGTYHGMRYRTYYLLVNNSEIKEYYCIHCKNYKVKLLKDIEQKNGLLTRNDNYYWNYKENKLKELDNYIKKYGNVNNISINDYRLNEELANENLCELIQELGYNFDDVSDNKPYGYYDNVDNLINEIKSFILKYDKFPTQIEMFKELGLTNKHIFKHFNSTDELKKYMVYSDKDDLIDNRGDFNKSNRELYVANYFVAQGLSDNYKREQYPFKRFDNSINYKSDFTFYLNNNKEIHIEVWACDNEENTSKFKNYYKTRLIKEKLYKYYKDNIILIGINKNVFSGTYKEIESNLYNIFKDHINLKFQIVDYNLLLSYNSYNEDELFNMLMEYSNDNNFMPNIKELRIDKNGNSLYDYILRRYGGLKYFSDKYKKEMFTKPNYYWNDEKVFQSFDYMINKYGQILSKSKCNNDIMFRGLYAYIKSIHYYKIRYIEYRLQNGFNIFNDMIYYLNNIINEYGNGIKNNKNITNEDRLLAQEILNNIKQGI